jgi:hypothetical protein
MFWIFPYWSQRLTRLEKGLIAFIAVCLFVAAVYRPVIEAYNKGNEKSVIVGSTQQAAAQPLSVQTSPAPVNQTPSTKPTQKHQEVLAAPSLKGKVHGSDNTLVGDVGNRSIKGNGNTIVGATDSRGNTILNQGGTAIGHGAMADSTSIAIGANAHAGQQTVNAPNGIGSIGGILINPQVINNRNPMPEINVTNSSPITPQPQSNPGERRRVTLKALYHPGASVMVTVEGIFYNPAFVANCNVPCQFVSLWLVNDGLESSLGGTHGDFQPLQSKDHMSAGVTYAKQMPPGFKVKLVFESLDDRQLTVSNVRPYAF